jgi:hypothetical protein
VGQVIATVWAKTLAFFQKVAQVFGDIGSSIVQGSSKIGSAIKDFLSDISFDEFLSSLNTGLLAGLLVIIGKFLSNLGLFGANGGFLQGLQDSLDAFTGSLKGMQNVLNASALLAIAVAIGVLTLSLVALSKIDNEGLIRASVAITVMMGQLAGAFFLFDKLATTFGAAKVGIMSAGFILLGVAIRILASSVKELSELSWEDLAKGLTGVMVLLASLAGATHLLNANAAGLIRTGAGLMLLAIAIRLLVTSVEPLAALNWENLARGLTGVATLLASLALFTKFAQANAGGIAQSIGIILLATALKILASAVGDFVQFNWEQLARGMSAIAVGLAAIGLAIGFLPPTSVISAVGVMIVAKSLEHIAKGVAEMSKLSWGEIGRGLTVMAGALTAIALAIGFLPPTSLLSAAAVYVVAQALGTIQEALGNMAGMSWEEIGRGLTVLAGSLLIIAGALFLMQTAVPGAVAVLIVAGALRVLVPVLEALAGMTWEEIGKGLAGLAGVFLILGAAGLVIGPLSPLIMALAASIVVLGAGVLLAGVGVLAFATGLGILATVGVAATAVLMGMVSSLIGLIPHVMEQIGLGLIAFAQVIAAAGPAITSAMTVVLISLIDSIIAITPKIGDLFVALLDLVLKIFVAAQPKLVDAGIRFVTAILRGIADNIGKLVDAGTDVIVNFLNGVGRNLPRIVQAGIDMIISALNGIADGLRRSGPALADAGYNIASGLVEGIIKGLGQLAGRAAQAAANLAKDMANKAMAALGINSPSTVFIWIAQQLVKGVVFGLDKYGHQAANAAELMGENVIDAMSTTLTGLSKVLGSDLMDFNPTISPVLDLSGVSKEAQNLSRLLALTPMDVSISSQLAQSAGSTYEENRSNDNDDDTPSGGDTYNYTQNNTSPKALSDEEIYRQTKNLISRKRGVGSNA